MTLIQIFVFAVFLIVLAMLYRNDHQDTQTMNGLNHQSIIAALETSPLYRDYAVALFECIRSNYQICELTRPNDITNHLAQMGQRAVSNNAGNIFFGYRFIRSVTLARIGQIEYSTMPVEKMVAQLNEAFPNYCRKYGLVPMYIVNWREGSNGTVYLYICPFASLQEAKQYLGWR